MWGYLLYRVGQFLALALPRHVAYGVAVFFSDVRYLFADKDRRAVRENLSAIFPDKTPRQIRQIRRRMFRNFAKYLVDFFRHSKIDREYVLRCVKIENLRYFDEALAGGKGVVVLTAHLGNWELGGVVMGLLGYPTWVVALPHKSKKVNDFFNAQREVFGTKVIPLGRAVRACLNLLKENNMIALVGDRDFTERGAVVDFFGKPTIFPEGPAALSLKTGAPIVAGFMVRNPDDTFTLRLEAPMAYAGSGNLKQDIPDLLNCYKATIERYIREYPDQWFMFRRFWVS
ncbi:MAG TPA: lysophospholipid acyltransferase family protein [Patescibacteria group bacterium]|nr:lysophospholipid acyltransferase family protein [Patescibacteria group bacterium]